MSFFGNVKRAFGFSDSEDDYTDEGIDATVKPVNSIGVNQQEFSGAGIVDGIKADKQADESLRLRIFDGVVSIFNEALPDFIKTCMDVDAQRKYIYDSLDESLKAYIDKVGEDARQRAVLQWEDERKKVQSEITQLKEQHKQAEENRADWQRQQLSAERQKRALTDRVHDLENQINKLEAEKEQYDLENKSLINKLKVSNVNAGDFEAMRQEISSLQEKLKEARDADKSGGLQALIDSANATIIEKDETIKALQIQLDAVASDNEAKDANIELEHLNGQIKDMTIENKRLSEAIEQLKAKEQIADAMINDLNAKASAAIHELEEKKQAFDVVEAEHNAAIDEIESLKEKMSLANQELQATQEELEEARSGLSAVDEIQEQISRFEDIKKKKDLRITELTEEAKQHIELIARLEEETKSLKKTIEKNLYSQAESERLLKNNIADLKAELEKIRPAANVSVPESQEKSVKRKRQVKISAIDESLDDTDWLVSVPPPGTPTRPVSVTTENDFGYQAPARKSAPENDAQMSLW